MIKITTQRLFFALSLPEKSADVLANYTIQHKAQISTTTKKVKWIPKENYHITLAFLGAVKTTLIGPLIEEVNNQLHLNSLKPQTVSLSSPYFLKTGHSQTIFAIKAEPIITLTQLAKLCQQSAKILNITDYSHSHFKPHITLARLKNINHQKKDKFLKQVNKSNQSVNEYFLAESFALFSSEQTAKGSIYHCQQRFLLK
ncbi:RNA 2',3'-cyclic phosphodiesterase [Piscirickettsia litoralis]|uniref:RNA 2',3'-cyclic phosphodiesterase n=1 Tax=Piscirickettsia litoralis TaxID=1891921 RepID=A0ABX3A671_9GAMM|nr:RNA 2',3'-cyclic phosphodiesterase [Piscirickettsia litoralis]ODN43191.1 2'-5' RNA ligase [Piscirickettsia litoralis]